MGSCRKDIVLCVLVSSINHDARIVDLKLEVSTKINPQFQYSNIIESWDSRTPKTQVAVAVVHVTKTNLVEVPKSHHQHT